MANTQNNEQIDIEGIIEEYSEDKSIFSTETDKVRKVKRFIFEKLDEVDRRCILLYAELGSLRKLGKVLGVSTSSAFLKIAEIKNKIKNAIDINEEDDTD